jgi:hypothetical protein
MTTASQNRGKKLSFKWYKWLWPKPIQHLPALIPQKNTVHCLNSHSCNQQTDSKYLYFLLVCLAFKRVGIFKKIWIPPPDDGGIDPRPTPEMWRRFLNLLFLNVFYTVTSTQWLSASGPLHQAASNKSETTPKRSRFPEQNTSFLWLYILALTSCFCIWRLKKSRHVHGFIYNQLKHQNQRPVEINPKFLEQKKNQDLIRVHEKIFFNTKRYS